MSVVPPASPAPHDPANPPPPVGAEEFALNVRLFWEKNRATILLAIAAIFVALLAFEGWDWIQTARERRVREDYAKVADRVEELPKFAAENAGHALAGVAWLRAADAAYGKGDFKAAASQYTKAADELRQVALRSRARLGAAMSQLGGEDAASAQSALKALGADPAAATPVRAEATYHLAVLTQDAGRTDEAKALLEEVGRIEPMGLWAQRALGLRAEIEAASAAPASPASPVSIEFKPGGR